MITALIIEPDYNDPTDIWYWTATQWQMYTQNMLNITDNQKTVYYILDITVILIKYCAIHRKENDMRN